MGGGSWTRDSFAVYTSATKGCSVDSLESKSYSAQEFYRKRVISDAMNPYKVTRECRDSEEHPHTFPVILALDVTGSMGDAAVRVAQKLNQIMTDIYSNNSVEDIEFCVMGIGDIAYDNAPIQISQFESDVRIAEQMDEIYFESGGGGNSYESYTAAWYMGVNHCDLDCWKRGKKGVIITLGDEFPNPHLPKRISEITGDNLQADVETTDLIEEAKKKYFLYHISIDDRSTCYKFYKEKDVDSAWRKLIGDNYKVCNLNSLAGTIVNIISECDSNESMLFGEETEVHSPSEVSW